MSERLTDDERAALVRGYHTPEMRGDPLVPDELREAYVNDATVHAVFAIEAAAGGSRETALIQAVKALLAEKVTLTAAVLDYARNAPPPVLHFEGPPPVVVPWRDPVQLDAPGPTAARELLAAALAWRAQGRKTKWSTEPSLHLVDVVDRMLAEFPVLCEAVTPKAKP